MKKSTIEIVILLLFSFLLFFYQADKMPQNLSYDEVAIANLVVSLDGKSYTPFNPLADGHATVYPYILLASIKTFGLSTFALRLPAKIFGIGCVILLYLIFKKIFPRQSYTVSVAFIAAFIFLSLRWFFNFVRFSFEMPFLLFLELASVNFTLSFLKSKKTLHLIFAGVFAGLAFNSYQPGRVFFLLPLLLLLLQRARVKSFLIFLLSFIILILPISAYLATHPENDIRINKQFFLKNDELTVSKKAQFLTENITGIVLMYFTKGDDNGRHNYPGKPALNPVLGVLFLVGLVLALKNITALYNAFFLAYFLIATAPSIFTYPWENPNMLRLYTVIPSVIYFVMQAILYIVSRFKKIIPSPYVFICIIAFILFSSFYDLRTYFKYQRQISALTFEISGDLKDLEKLLKMGKTDDELYKIYNPGQKK